MKKEIFYFTGTGNSLYIAEKLKKNLEGFTLHSIVKDSAMAAEDGERQIVIVCPIYMHNLPWIVRDFMERIQGKGCCSLVLAGGGDGGKCFITAKKIFKRKEMKLISLFNIPLPVNYTPFGVPSEEEQKSRFANAESRIAPICRIIEEKSEYSDDSNTGLFGTFVHPGIMYSMGYKYIRYLDKSYSADSRCNGCGICVKVCPVNNIELLNSNPRWMQNCQQCFACLQWCPEEALQYGKKTASIGRYRNPEVQLKDIIDSNKTK